MNIDDFQCLDRLRSGHWNDCRGEVLRLGWVELHNYDSERKGLFSDELNKISGLTSHCSLRGFAWKVKQMSAALTSRHNSDKMSINYSQYARNFMTVWERFRAKVEECWPEANRDSEVNNQDNFASAQYPQETSQGLDVAVLKTSRQSAPSKYAVSTALAKHAIIPGRSLSINYTSSASSCAAPAAVPAAVPAVPAAAPAAAPAVPAAAPAAAALSSFTARSTAPVTTEHVRQAFRQPENAQISSTHTAKPSSVSEAPRSASAVEIATASTSMADLKEAAQQHLSKLSKTSAGFVSERLLLHTAWKFMSECDKLKTFAQPVSAKAAPDYSDIIKKKMALSNMQTKVKHGNYGTLEAFGKDIQLIVDNCNLYNTGILYYTKQAEEFLAAWRIYYEKAIVLRKDQPVVEPSPPVPISTTVSSDSVSERTNHMTVRARGNLTDLPVQSTAQEQAHPANNRGATVLGKHPRTNPVNNNNNTIVQAGWPVTPRTLQPLPEPLVLSRSVMRSLLREVVNSEFAGPFLDPVDLDEAPGYAEMIVQPMDLTTLLSNIHFGFYDHSTGRFVEDVRMIWENCVKYNELKSNIALCAANFGEQFETQLGLVLDQMKKEQQEKQQQEGEKNKKRTPIVGLYAVGNAQPNIAKGGNLQMTIHPPTIGAKRSEAPATVVTEKASKAPRVLPTNYSNVRAATLPATVPPASALTTTPAVSTTSINNTKNSTRTTPSKAVATSTAGVPVPFPVVPMTITAKSSAPAIVSTLATGPPFATSAASATVPATLTARATAPVDAPAPMPAAVPVTVPATVNSTAVPAADPASVPAAVPLETQVEILKFLTQHGDETFKKDAMHQLLALATQR